MTGTDIVVKDLIAEVYKHPVLWDRTCKNYHNRYVLEKNWRQIEEELGNPKAVLKKKWKNIRDQYRTECKRMRSINSDDSGDKMEMRNSCWPYFKLLHFLDDQMKPYISVDEVLSSPSYYSSDLDELMDSLPLNEVQQSTSQVENNTPQLVASTDLLATQEQKQVPLQTTVNSGRTERERDDDQSFFDSLLPYVRRMDMNKKLRCRMKIQQIIYAYSFGDCGDSESFIEM